MDSGSHMAGVPFQIKKQCHRQVCCLTGKEKTRSHQEYKVGRGIAPKPEQ